MKTLHTLPLSQWVNSTNMCLGFLGASLVSIQDPIEAEFIQKNIESLQDEAKTFWIGLYKSRDSEHNRANFRLFWLKKCNIVLKKTWTSHVKKHELSLFLRKLLWWHFVVITFFSVSLHKLNSECLCLFLSPIVMAWALTPLNTTMHKFGLNMHTIKNSLWRLQFNHLLVMHICLSDYCFSALDEWMWIDNSVVDYTNWKIGMPKSDSCVNIHSDSGEWSTNSCSRYRSYICKRPKGEFNLLLCYL